MRCIERLGAAAPESRLAIEEVHNGKRRGAGRGWVRTTATLFADPNRRLLLPNARSQSFYGGLEAVERENGADKVACRTAKWRRGGGVCSG